MLILRKIDAAIKAVICAVIVALAMPALALADDNGRRRGRDNDRNERSYNRRDRRDDDNDRWDKRRFKIKKFKRNFFDRWDDDDNNRRRGDRRRRGNDRFDLRFFR